VLCPHLGFKSELDANRPLPRLDQYYIHTVGKQRGVPEDNLSPVALLHHIILEVEASVIMAFIVTTVAKTLKLNKEIGRLFNIQNLTSSQVTLIYHIIMDQTCSVYHFNDFCQTPMFYCDVPRVKHYYMKYQAFYIPKKYKENAGITYISPTS